jgi:cardiolipin synthase
MEQPIGTAASDPDGTDRVLTLPNAITVVRLLCLPIFVYLLFGRDNRAAAAWLLAALGATDWVDGFLARHLHQVSTVGKVLDPVADRLLFFIGVGGIIIDGSIPAWVAATIFVREGLVSVATIALAAIGVRRIDVTWVGKAGTFALMFAVPMFLGAESTLSYNDVFDVLKWLFAIPGLALSIYSALLYIPMARRAMAERTEAQGVAA